ncbi:MAG: rod shape-determining protein MreC [Clostridia bacterium]|nr:rod shape-determining protein MreC [Clostridia bacterium]
MNRNKQTETLGGIITLIILVLLIFLSNVQTSKLSFFEGVASSVFSPIQNLFISLKNKATGNSKYFSDMELLIAENEELKEKNRSLEEQVRELEIVKADNETMQEYMNLTQKYAEYETIPAYVINKDVSNLSSTLIINAGTEDGVAENMTVIADQGLVGHIISVSKHTSKVQVIIDPASTVSCLISTTEQSIICKGTLDNDQTLRASFIPTGAELIQGDTVSTSGIGGIYRKGIRIGTIKEIVTTSNVIDRYAIVEPAVDFSTVNNVLIIAE